MRKFKGKTTRSPITGKAQYVKFMSPLALKAYGEYMLKHQTQENGEPREADNWRDAWDDKEWNDGLLDSAFRHMHDWWMINQGYEGREDEVEALCAIMFGVQARLHNIYHGSTRSK